MIGTILKILSILWSLIGPLTSLLGSMKKKTPDELKAEADAKAYEAQKEAEVRKAKALSKIQEHAAKREARRQEILARLEERRRRREEQRARIRKPD